MRPDSVSIVELTAPAPMGEVLCDLLWSMGVGGIEELPADGNIVVYRTSLGDDPRNLLASIREALPEVEHSIIEVPVSVVESWRDHARVTRVDEDVIFVPAWLDTPQGRVVVRIEPYEQFGLGNHPTTVLAARLLNSRPTVRGPIMDLGSGSGVLSVLAAMTRDNAVMANDIAPGSRSALESNLGLNGIAADRVAWVDDPQLLNRGSVGLIVANILAPVLRTLAPMVRHIVGTGGEVILSGVRTEQLQDVLDAYQPARVVDAATDDGWSAVVIAVE